VGVIADRSRPLPEAFPARHQARRDYRTIPGIRDRIELYRAGLPRRGTVFYADELQVLVKWDDGQSSSLRVGRDRFKIIERAAVNGTPWRAAPPSRANAEETPEWHSQGAPGAGRLVSPSPPRNSAVGLGTSWGEGDVYSGATGCS
jgi:hypothetical protein